jgi:hypothetical protein
MILKTKGAVRIFVKIQLSFSLLNMMVHPPMHWLDIAVPWIPGIVRMTIIAGLVEDDFYIIGNGEDCPKKIRLYPRRLVLYRVNKLDNNQ